MGIINDTKPTMYSEKENKPNIGVLSDFKIIREVILGRGMPIGLLLSLTYPQDTTILK